MSSSLAEALGELAARAAVPVLRVYEDQHGERSKHDGSPVTEADEAAEAVIVADLRSLLPDTVVLAEEACASQGAPRVPGRFVLVDALDGTREFLRQNGEFTVNIALVENGAPVCGAVYAPVSRRLWIGARGEGAEAMTLAPGAAIALASDRRSIRVRSPQPEGLVVLVSRSHLEADTRDYVSRLPLARLVAAGSSIKFCLIAEGLADLYPRFGPTMEWDTAAGDAVLRAAGGRVDTLDGRLLRYGNHAAAFRNPSFVARGGL